MCRERRKKTGWYDISRSKIVQLNVSSAGPMFYFVYLSLVFFWDYFFLTFSLAENKSLQKRSDWISSW